ncbi:MAG: hypothetical protein K0Q76_3656 [Panacagrimonas sp.]|jgi:hypothetical protein|nr:Abi-alpha family protein [Panacagrimonas sp.]MCC2658548.1 hypothetical protein [Panacagrimonas sp.]
MSKQPIDDDGESPATPQEPTSLFGYVTSGAWKLATGAPRFAIDLAHKGISEAEKRALNSLRRRMDAVADDPSEHDDDDAPHARPMSHGARGEPAAASGSGAGGPPAPRVSASALLARLLEDSAEQTVESAQERLNLRLIRQLVPDEARILAALADGHSAALVHLGAGPRVGPASQRWLENLSPVGRECGARLLDQTPNYIRHLRDLGLLESGEEDKSLHLKYQLIEADTQVRKACAEIEKSGMRPKFFRRTIRISEAGLALWKACEGTGNQSW